MAKNKKGKSGPPSISKRTVYLTEDEIASIRKYAMDRLMYRERTVVERDGKAKEYTYAVTDGRGLPI